MSSSSPLRGVFAPVLTPFNTDLSPAVEKWVAHSRWLLENGCHGLCPFGTTSEANSLGLDERMSMLEQLLEAGIPAAKLMPGTGTCAIPDTVRLTTHAVKLGCAGVLMLPPFYYKGVSDEGIYASIAEVIERVGDARLRVYLYHIPPIAQVGFSLDVIGRLRNDYPTTMVGLKDSSGDWNNLHNILTNFPEFGTFAGSEKFLLQTLRLGGVGTISAMNNVIPDTVRHLYDNWLSENAERLQEDANATRNALTGYAPIPALKQMVARRLNDPEWATVRPPFVQPTPDQAGELFARLEKIGAATTAASG